MISTDRTWGPVRAFRSGNFALFWVASLFSIVSFFILFIARGWLVLEMTDSRFMVTAVAGAAQLPSLFLSIPGGVLADRFNRKAILVAGEALNMVALFALALLVMSGVVQTWYIFLVGLVNGSAFALAFPARAAVVPSLVPREDIANGVALSSTMFSGAMLVGPAIAGWLLASYPIAIAFIVLTAASAASVLLFFFVRVTVVEAEARAYQGSVSESIGEGLSYIRHHQVLPGLMMIGLVGVVFGMPYQTVLPVFARDVLSAGELGLGLLGAAGGLGAIVGSLMIAAFSSRVQMQTLQSTGVLCLGISIVFFSLSPVFPISLLLALLTGLLLQMTLMANFALLQVLVPVRWTQKFGQVAK